MALYHSARGSVDYTIVGTPTIVDGVVSGFSYSPANYIAISPAPTLGTNDFEIKTAFVANSIQGKRILATQGAVSTISGISIIDDRRITANFYNGTSRSLVASSVSYTTDQKYYVIMYRKGTTIGIKVSTDNMSYTENTSTIGASDSVVFSTWLGFGINLNGGVAFDGSIDLNDTYIKVNGQPWFGICPIEVKHINYGTSVGYTKIGNPTISNGIVTYARSANCLSLTKNFELVNNEVEFVTKITGESVIFQGSLSNSKKFQLSITSGGAFYLYINDSPVLGLANAASYGYVRFHKTADGSVTTLQAGNDGVNWTISNTGNNLQYTNFDSNRFCAYADTGKTIDLNHTYIKLNSKLWFYRPCTNYLVKDNKLIWADSGIYVQEPSSGSALDSNTVALYHFDDNLNEEVSGVTATVSSGTPTYETGEFDKALASSVTITGQGTVSDSSSFTIDFWIMVTDNAVCGVFFRSDTSNYANAISYLMNSQFTVGAWVNGGNSQVNMPFPTGFTLLNTWHHIAFVYDKSASKIYGFIDGTKVVEGNYQFPSATQLSFIKSTSNIKLDELRLSNTARWTSDFTVPTEPYGSLVPGAKNYATPTMAPVPAGYTYGTTTTTAIGYVDIPTQAFTAAPAGSTLGKDE